MELSMSFQTQQILADIGRSAMVRSDRFTLVKFILDTTYRLKKCKFQLPCWQYIYSNVFALYK